MNSPHQAAARLDGGETLSKSSHRVGRARELTFAATARDSTAHGNAGIENDSSQPAPSAQLANVVKPSGCARGVDGLCASIGSSSSGTMAASRLAPGSAPMTETCAASFLSELAQAFARFVVQLAASRPRNGRGVAIQHGCAPDCA